MEAVSRQDQIINELYPDRRHWDFKWRPYLRYGDNFIGPFVSYTAAFRHRRDFGPVEAHLSQAPDHMFIGSLFPPKSPQQHRWECIFII